jgi:hypothetical protein
MVPVDQTGRGAGTHGAGADVMPTQPSGFSAILRAGDSECQCCRRRFADAG